MLQLYSFFHLNLAFSSIEEEVRPEVIQRCYWPLLRLIREQQLPIGIEASGYTLEQIQQLDPSWVEELRELCSAGVAEFIGSGYAQLIGPLVPAEVNKANQRIGLQVYEKLLGFRPELVLVNEQAYSAGLVPIYREAGYRALIMEWDNPGSARQDWNPDWRYLPQYACGADGSTLPVIWNKSIPFQKFQRYAHAEMELPKYLEFLGSRVGNNERTFSIYGNDAEIFDFRPGRFQTEARMSGESEWLRIARLYRAVQSNPRFKLIRPSQVLNFLDHADGGHPLHLETAQNPIPVKKQNKYNVARWALTGRDDLDINNKCWRVYHILQQPKCKDIAAWKELCYLWSSDFRTHITPRRWQQYGTHLEAMLNRLESVSSSPETRHEEAPEQRLERSRFTIQDEKHYLNIETGVHSLRLNKRRGLALERWTCSDLSPAFMLGTLEHGFFDDIAFGADYYSGLTVLEAPGQHKVTDLSAVSPSLHETRHGLQVRAQIQTALGLLEKILIIKADEPEISIRYCFEWPTCPAGSLRLGTLTLNPAVFEPQSLFYRTHNGGDAPETFALDIPPVHHGAPVSTIVSSSQGVGLTEGVIEIGDQHRSVLVRIHNQSAGVLGQIFYQPVGDTYLCRVNFSAMEMDDTVLKNTQRHTFAAREISFTWRLGYAGQISY
jgi:hypothetical protein